MNCKFYFVERMNYKDSNIEDYLEYITFVFTVPLL